MAELMKPVDVAVAFTRAWTSQDLDLAATFVAEDAVFDGPMGHMNGAKAYVGGLTGLSKEVIGLNIIAAFGDEERALLMYDLMTKSYGTLRCAKLLMVKDGKILDDKLTFDSYLIRSSRKS
jgi:hypothetical protein